MSLREATLTQGPSCGMSLIWTVSPEDFLHSASDPQYLTSHCAQDKAIDHNLYILGNKAYLTNYCDGLRVLGREALNLF
jgi:hypothetical protein